MTVFIDATGLPDLQKYFDRAPENTRRAARLAINDTAERKGLKAAREAMLLQVAFPTGYLNTPRFGVTRKATDSNLFAAISGRFTPTSLARFTERVAAGRGRGGGVSVQVNPGRLIDLPRAFLITLRNGNLGLAIRLKPGEQLRNRHLGTRTMTSGPLKGITLLYGPSVDQVFRTVAADISPALLDNLQTEFLRQFVRLQNDG